MVGGRSSVEEDISERFLLGSLKKMAAGPGIST